MLVSSTLCGSTQAHGQTLVVETADASSNFVGAYSSIALDPFGNPHVTYHDDTSGDLVYARKIAGDWMLDRVDLLNDVGAFSSIALDLTGSPHVSYFDDTTDNLKYARQTGGVWTIETADASVNDVGRYSSIALDALVNPHVTYQDATTNDLKYARRAGGSWTVETADGSANGVGYYSSIAIDKNGNLHVSYQDFTASDLKYARKAGGAWTLEIADENQAGLSSAIALDPLGDPHVSYYSGFLSNLMHAWKSGVGWTIETVDASVNNVGTNSSLVIDPLGDVHVSYSDNSTGDTKYARKSGGRWTIETIDASVSTTGLFTSIALDASQRPHVSYQDGTTGDLKYAYVPSIVIESPQQGVTWPVGSEQAIRWSYTGGLGTDLSDVFLSVDGGRTYDMIEDDVRDFSVTIRVPHSPTRFARIKVVQPSPFTVGRSDSFFTIDATITLARFDATRDASGEGTRLTWETRPGPEADIRYRIERATDGPGFTSIAAGLDRGEYVDQSPATASRYRLIAINGLGEEYVLGETSVAGALAVGHDLSAQPNPAPGGSATFTFRAPFDAASGGASDSRIEVALFDLSGRKVVTLADGQRASGVHSTTWDGRDDAGRDVAAGVYFAQLSWNGAPRATERVTIIR